MVGQIAFDRNGGGQGGAYQPDDLPDDFDKRDRFDFLIDLPAESQDLLDQIAGALGGIDDAPAVFAQGLVAGVFKEHQLGPAHNRCQDVVEIVGNAPGKAADGLEFLRLLQLFFKRFVFVSQSHLFGDVDDGDEDFAPGVLKASSDHYPPFDGQSRSTQRSVFENKFTAAVLGKPQQFVFKMKTLVVGQNRGELAQGAGSCGPVHFKGGPVGIDDPHHGGATDQAFRVFGKGAVEIKGALRLQLIDEGFNRAQILFHQRNGRVFKEQAITCLGLFERFGCCGNNIFFPLVENDQHEEQQGHGNQSDGSVDVGKMGAEKGFRSALIGTECRECNHRRYLLAQC